MLKKNIKKILEKAHYSVVGKHSAVQICRWTKKSLIDEGFCYKEKFYGIKSHLCCQMSPYISCQNECVHCWRPIELESGVSIKPRIKEINSPKKIISDCIKAQRKLLSGFGGNDKLNLKKFKEAQEPKLFAISLIGEPTIYPKLGELIKELKKQNKQSFLVTNGLYPKKLLELKKKNQLPTQVYVSLNSPNKEMYLKWHRSKEKNAWGKFNQTLELLPKLNTRKVIRMTLVKDLNMKNTKEYAQLIKKASPDFIEIKGFMSVGFSRKRLGYDRMPNHKEIKEFSKKIERELKKERYKFLDEKIESRVVLLGKDKSEMFIKNC